MSLPTVEPVGDSHNINSDMRAAESSGDMLSLQEKAPSRGMRYLVIIIKKFLVSTRNTSSSPTRTHTLLNKNAQRKEGTTRTHGSMAHMSALGLVLFVYCVCYSRWVRRPKPGQQKKIVWTRPHACMSGISTYDKKIFVDDEKAMLIPTQVSRDIQGG